MPRDFLKAEHPIYAASVVDWARNERRLRGGVDVRRELKPFDFEEGEYSPHYQLRQLMATYLNFPDIHATTTLGHLMSKAPSVGPNGGLSFGTLGEVGGRGRFSGTLGERLYYNVDGVGNDGSQWDNWWMTVSRYAMATGHRWIYVDHPQEAPVTLARQKSGLHPYLVEFSPVDVPVWSFSRGRLNFAVVLLNEERPTAAGGQLKGLGDHPDYLLMVRRGFRGLDQPGEPYSVGGWFRFNVDLQLVDFGSWDLTNGEIPMFPYFYERMKSARGANRHALGMGVEGAELAQQLAGQTLPLLTVPASLSISRPGVAELGNLAVSYMNLDSAADFDTWDAAMSVKFIIGGHPEGLKVVREWMKNGSRIVPIPADPQGDSLPSVVDGSGGAVAAEVFNARLAQKIENARHLSVHETTSTPDASGVSKMAGFGEFKAPRLVLQAGELEQAQNTALHFLEMRAGARTPTGGVTWTRDFELEPVADAIEAAFSVEKLAGLNSRELKANLMVTWLKKKGLVTDEAEAQKVRAEYIASIQEAEAQRQAEQDAFAETGL